MFLFSLLSREALAVLAAAAHVQLVEWWIARLVGNALRVHGSDETLGGDFRKLLVVHMENVGILPVASAAFVKFLRRNAGNLAQPAVQQAGILVATFGLFVKTTQLDIQNGALPFAKPVIRSVNIVAVKPLAGHASGVVYGTGLHFEIVIIGNDHPTFARGDQLAGLKAERARNAECANSLPAPLTGVCVCRVFDQCQSPAVGNF